MRLLRSGLFVLAAFLLALAPLRGHAQTREYQVKAVFLLNFTHFISWPSNVFTNSTQPFQIGILGENPFSGALIDVFKGETFQQRPIHVVESREFASLAQCQMLFISRSESDRLELILSQLGSRPVLTVADVARVSESGVMIQLYREENNVRFAINPEAARKGGLTVSSRLLRVGRVVGTDGGGIK